MTIPTLVLTMIFDGTSMDVSDLVRTYEPTDRAMSEDFGHAISSRSIVLIYSSHVAALLASSVEIRVIATLDGIRDFTGRVTPSASITSRGAALSDTPDIDDIPIVAEDLSSLLDREITSDDNIALENFTVCDPANPASSLVHYLCALSGASTAIIDGINVTLRGFAIESGTVGSHLSTLLGEYGYEWRMDEYSRVVLVRWLFTAPSPTATLDENTIIGDLRAERLAIETDAVEVSWTALKDRSGALVYMADLPFGDDNRRSGWPIQPGYLYPEEANTAETWWTYDDVALASRIDARGSVIKESDFTGLVLTKNHTVEQKIDAGIALEFAEFQNKRARIGYQCTAAEPALIFYCNILADVVYRGAQTVERAEIAPNPKSVERYDSLYINDQSHAQALCMARAGRLRSAAWRYTCRSEIQYPIGSITSITDPYSGVSAIAIIIELCRDLETGIITYKAVGLPNVGIAVGTMETQILVAPASSGSVPEIQLERCPTFTQIQTGYNVSGGTTTPAVPTLKTGPGPQAVYITIDRQSNLTNYSHDELQVTDNPAADWYALRMDGGDWKGGVGAVTAAPSLFTVHANVPLVATVDPASGETTYSARQLWYRARRCTRAGVRSEWCQAVEGVAAPSDGSSIAEASISASKLQTGVFEAVVAAIRDSLTIDADLGFAAENEDGNERTQFNELSMSFQRLVGSIWQNIVRIGLDGLQSQIVHSSGALVLTNNGMSGATGRRANGTDIGIPFPSAGARIFHLDGDILDQSGASWWAVSGAAPSYDTADVAIAATSPFSTEAGALAGGVSLSKSAGSYLLGHWWVDLWVRTTGLDEAYDIVAVGNATTNLGVRRVLAPSFWAQYNRPKAYADSGYFGPETDIANIEATWAIDGTNFSQPVDIDESGWVHVALGHSQVANAAYVVVGGYLLVIPGWAGIFGAAVMDIVINPDLRGMKIDEIMVDTTTAIDTTAVFASNNNRIPWAALDYADKPFVLDIANPDGVSQNLVRSSWDGSKWICKLPDGTQLEWAADGQPVYARRWK
jgi:hypothetical protein